MLSNTRYVLPSMTRVANSLAVASFVALIALLSGVSFDWRKVTSLFHGNANFISTLPDLPSMPVLSIDTAQVDIDVKLLQNEVR